LSDLAQNLAAALPDEPWLIDVRGILRSGHAVVTGGSSIADGFVARVVHDALSVIGVIGRPPCAAVIEATRGITTMTPVIAQTGDAAHVGRCLSEAPRANGNPWRGERMIVHTLQAPISRPSQATLKGSHHNESGSHHNKVVRLLTANDTLSHLPPGLRHEITHARELSPVASVFVDGRAASFCYAVWTTESLWDVSIDTLEEFRGQSLGPHAVWFMAELMQSRGCAPVWAALESNTASLRLAAKLGFRPVGDIVAFSRGHWSMLTAGFVDGANN
jgi:GNAT acetyltransferase-like protein